jgi:aerobic carbon-monoxide dehydrogenase medium subunit
MKPQAFTYVRPTNLAAVLAELQAGAGMARPLAGGQSLVPLLNLRLAPVDRLVALDGLDELRRVQQTPDTIRYGALLTHAAFEDGSVPDAANGLLAHVAARIAFRSVRTRGTIGGALALADPAADWLTTCLALEARIHLHGPAGPRVLAMPEFVLGAYLTALEPDEILTAVDLPVRPATERWGYAKVAVKVGEYAKSLAIALADPRAGTARLVLGAVDGAPLVLGATAAAGLAGADPDRLARLAREEIAVAGRAFTPARMAMHVTTALRALREALTQ